MADIHRLNEALFDQLDRINKARLNETDQLEATIKQAEATEKISREILKGAMLALKAEELKQQYNDIQLPEFIAPKALPDKSSDD